MWAPGGSYWSSGGGARVVFTRKIFILNEVWEQNKTNTFFRHCLVSVFYMSLSTGTSSEL
jgi:hypothetical protein